MITPLYRLHSSMRIFENLQQTITHWKYPLMFAAQVKNNNNNKIAFGPSPSIRMIMKVIGQYLGICTSVKKPDGFITFLHCFETFFLSSDRQSDENCPW